MILVSNWVIFEGNGINKKVLIFNNIMLLLVVYHQKNIQKSVQNTYFVLFAIPCNTKKWQSKSTFLTIFFRKKKIISKSMLAPTPKS